MAKRSIRKTRHRSDVEQAFSFKVKSELGVVKQKLAFNQMTFADVPPHLLDLLTAGMTSGDELSVEQTSSSPDVTPAPEEHVHGEHCHH